MKTSLKIQPNNHKVIFQLGNIFLIEKNYISAVKYFNEAVKIKNDFWQAFNNIGLAYFEQDNISLSIDYFKKALTIEENAEPLLALASCISVNDIDSAISLVKKALIKDPQYVDFDYRKEQLWGEKIQNSTEKLFKNRELKKDITFARSKIDNPY